MPIPLPLRPARPACGLRSLTLTLTLTLTPALTLGYAALAAAQAGSPAPALAAAPVAGELPSIVVTATRSPERIENLVADISTLGGDLDRRGLNLQDLLRTAGGVQLTSNGGPAATGSAMIRGANAGHTLTLIEGFRVSSALLGQATFEALPLAHTDRLEILRGPASALYGADALGGVVQLFAPTAPAGLQMTGEAAYGQQNTRQLQAGLSGGSETIRGGILLNQDSSDGFNATAPANFAHNPDRDGYRREGLSAYADARLATGTRLRAILLQNRLASDYDDGAFSGAQVKARLELVGLSGTHELDPLTQLGFKLGQSTDESDNRSSFPGRFTSRQLQYGISATRQVTSAARVQLLLERLEERASSTSFESGVSARRLTDSAGLVLSGDEGPHLLQAGVRVDDSDQFDRQTNYSLSYGYRLGGGVRLGGGYATGFHAPGFNDLHFPNYGRSVIRPERSRSAELGLYWNGPAAAHGTAGGGVGDAGTAGGWHAKAVLFRSRIRDLISFASVCPDPSPQFAFGCASNVDRARIQGISLSLGHLGHQRPSGAPAAGHGLSWYLNLDFLDPRNQTTGTRLARRAKRQLTAGIDYGWGAATLGADVVAASRRFDDAANQAELGGYAVVNLRAAYRFSPQWQGFATVANAADRSYVTALDYVQQGRLVMIGVRYAGG